MEMNNEVKCPICGKTGVSGELTVIDSRTGKKATGLGTLLFGIILVAIAVFMLVLIIISWNSRMVQAQRYIYLPIVLLIGGVPTIYSRLMEDRVKIVIYKCASCGKTITQDELEGTNLATNGTQARIGDNKGRIIGDSTTILPIVFECPECKTELELDEKESNGLVRLLRWYLGGKK